MSDYHSLSGIVIALRRMQTMRKFKLAAAGLGLALLAGACVSPGTAGLSPAAPGTAPPTGRTAAPAQAPAASLLQGAIPVETATPGVAAAAGRPLHLRPAATARGQLGPVTALAWSPDGRELASSSGDLYAGAPTDGDVHLWTADGRPLATLRGHSARVYALEWSPDGARLASGSADGTVRLWDAAGHALKTLSTASDPVLALAWSPDGRLLAAGAIHFVPPQTPGAQMGLPGIVHLWQLDGTPVRTLATQYTGGKFYNLAWSEDGALLAAGAVDYRIWQRDGTLLGSTPGCPRCTPEWGMAWMPESHDLALGDESGNVEIYGPTGQLLDLTGQLRAAGAAGNGITNGVNQLAFSPDGKLLAVGSLPPRLVPLDDLGKFTELSGSQVPLAWSSNGLILATGARDTAARLWRADGSLLAILDGCSGETLALAWSPDARTLALGSAGHDLCLWQTPN